MARTKAAKTTKLGKFKPAAAGVAKPKVKTPAKGPKPLASPAAAKTKPAPGPAPAPAKSPKPPASPAPKPKPAPAPAGPPSKAAAPLASAGPKAKAAAAPAKTPKKAAGPGVKRKGKPGRKPKAGGTPKSAGPKAAAGPKGSRSDFAEYAGPYYVTALFARGASPTTALLKPHNGSATPADGVWLMAARGPARKAYRLLSGCLHADDVAAARSCTSSGGLNAPLKLVVNPSDAVDLDDGDAVLWQGDVEWGPGHALPEGVADAIAAAYWKAAGGAGA